MARFRKKPIEIDAVHLPLHPDDIPSWIDERTGAPIASNPNIILKKRDGIVIEAVIATLEGVMVATQGDWIIRGVKGELYPCKPEIFDATYERVG